MNTKMELDYQKAEEWGLFGQGARPAVIAGPCSAESERQVMETAQALRAAGVEVFRAGVWKPRTHPGSFEGVGTAGLPWLQRVRRELGMKVGTEVATGEHVREALEAGMDWLWVGARTSANPFAMQELAEALGGTEVPVLVKNPVNPDVELWLGALERLSRAGVRKLGVIHRGFSVYGETKYRNVPQWQLPIEVRRRCPDLLMLCDPSHIAGRREYVAEVAQQALDLGFDGLMIEAHIHPEKAWSDSSQQVNPCELKQLVESLVVRAADTENGAYRANIDELRMQINGIDRELLDLLARRMEIAGEIGRYKHQNNIAILQPGRWEEVLERVFAYGREKGLGAEFLKRVFTAIHQASIDRQARVMREE